MNNLRFTFSGKRKFRSGQTSLGEQTDMTITIADVKKNLGTTTGNFRITHIDFELIPSADASAINQIATLNVLGRPAEIVATNSVGPDGVYKIPDAHILRNWINIDDKNFDTYVLVLFPVIDKGVQLSVNVYGEFVQ